MKQTLIIILVITSFNLKAFVTLGSDNSCDYNTSLYSLQDLIDLNTGLEIRVTTQSTLYENIEIDQSITIKGGYQNCDNADADIVSNSKTVIDGGAVNSVIEISQFDSPINVGLHHLNLKNGMKLGSNSGGGMSIIDANDVGVNVSLYRSLISNNTGGYGGGIYFNSDFGAVSLYESIILNNDATDNGGGISCYGGYVNVGADSGVILNSVFNTGLNYGNGGGIFAAGGCKVTVYSGTQGSLFEFKGIAGNTASNNGGGIYASSGSRVVLNSNSQNNVININGNAADSDSSYIGNGGGIYLTGQGTSAELYGALIKENFAQNGGGIAVENSASLYLGKYMGVACWNDNLCNEFVGNGASKNSGFGGAVYLNAGHVDMQNSAFHENRAESGVVMYATNSATAKLRNSFVYNNGSNGTDGWNDVYTLGFYDSGLILNHVTMANNLVTGASIRQNSGYYSYTNSIIREPHVGLGADITNIFGEEDCLLLHDDTGFDNLTNSMVANPYFVDETNHDYRLSAISFAIDMCGEDAHTLPKDFYGNAMWDDPNLINDHGIRDAGAHESYMGDVIFMSGF
ncbi:MAG: hypothetical protein R3E90_06745 [Marinicella sp.]